jgi:hypothetical protein
MANLPNESPNSGTAHLIRHGTDSLRRTRELLARKKLPGLIQLQDPLFVNYRATAPVVAVALVNSRKLSESIVSLLANSFGVGRSRRRRPTDEEQTSNPPSPGTGYAVASSQLRKLSRAGAQRPTLNSTPLCRENLSSLKKIPRPEIAPEINLAWATSTPAGL